MGFKLYEYVDSQSLSVPLLFTLLSMLSVHAILLLSNFAENEKQVNKSELLIPLLNDGISSTLGL